MHNGREVSVLMFESLAAMLHQHLLRQDGNEDVCFALYRPVIGTRRTSALLCEAVLPNIGERRIHGNVSITPTYIERVVEVARRAQAGIALLHSHPASQGWQVLSPEDEIAERRLAPAALAATGLPLVGLTLAGDKMWGGRVWERDGVRSYRHLEASNVRVVGKALTASFPNRYTRSNPAFDRTDSVWGRRGRETLSRLRLGIVGLGSVGSVIAEQAVRIGVEDIVEVDHDSIELVNLDRTLNATASDLGKSKVDVSASAIRGHGPGQSSIVQHVAWCDSVAAYSGLLDCDVIFCCVDRSWGRRILNQLAYTAGIPVVNGGILARSRKGRFIGLDAHVHVVGPERRCMECWKAFDPSEAALERDGLLNDPSYLRELDPGSPSVSHANAFPYALAVAAMQFMQYVALALGPVHSLGDRNFHASTFTIDATPDMGCEPGCVYAAIAGCPESTPPLREMPITFIGRPMA